MIVSHHAKEEMQREDHRQHEDCELDGEIYAPEALERHILETVSPRHLPTGDKLAGLRIFGVF